MQRKAILIVATVGMLALVATAIQFYDMRLSVETIQVFLGLSLGSCLILLLAWFWVGIYLKSLERELGSLAAEAPEAVGQVRALRRRTDFWLVSACVLSIAVFFAGKLTINTTLPKEGYYALLVVSLGVQVFTTWRAARALAASDRQLEGLDQAFLTRAA